MPNTRIRLILALILTSCFLSSSLLPSLYAANIVSMEKERSAAILERFKQSEKVLLFETSPFPQGMEKKLFIAERKANSLAQMLVRINSTKNQYKEMKRGVVEKKFSLKDALRQIDMDIEQTQTHLRAREAEMAVIEMNMSSTRTRMEALESKITTNKAILLQYLQVIYTKGDSVFSSEDQDVDLLKTLVMNSSDAARVLDDIYSQVLLELAGKEFIDNYRRLVASLYSETLALEENKSRLEGVKKDLEQYNIELDDQKLYKEALLDQAKDDESRLNNLIIERSESSQKIAEHLEEVSSLYQNTFREIAIAKGCPVSADGQVILGKSASAECVTLSAYFQAEKSIMTSGIDDDDKNPLLWPVANPRISTFFHDDGYYSSLGSHHDAIDIAVPQSSAIFAPADGYVYYINPPTKTGYGYIAIKHPNGFMTVYGHISSVEVSKFDKVSRGQLIAKSGGARGTMGAGPMTSGPHLHFEVFKDGEAVDPLQYLDLSPLNPASLTERYLDKHAGDSSGNPGVSTQTKAPNRFVLQGESEVARQKYLLNTYATKPFQDWDMWTDEALSGGIDPSFLMCIGLAETSLGRSLKTGYNIGNVGNTDSGDTKTFSGPALGVRMIVKTLNNRYLGNYTRIEQLSRYGNTTGPIYASSNKNWHANVTRCMSAVKGKYVPDGQLFRMSISSAKE